MPTILPVPAYKVLFGIIAAMTDLNEAPSFYFLPMTSRHGLDVLSWQYADEYAFYNGASEDLEDDLEELLDGAQYAAIDELGTLAGFFAVGQPAQVPGESADAVYRRHPGLDIGLGLRPDLTGLGLGSTFVEAGLDFVHKQFAPTTIRLSVATFNCRAITVYERVGFKGAEVFYSRTPAGDSEFLLMTRASGATPH